jgi:uncharacterized protein with von Willebrand factor type A (vWA) domain
MIRENLSNELFKLTPEALKSLVKDARAQVDAGLMSRKEAHDRINCISAVLMTKEVEMLTGERHANA